MKKVMGVAKVIAEWISLAALVSLTIALFVGVLSRYVFKISIPEIEVVRKFAIMWLVFMGSAVAVQEDAHLEIDIFSEYLGERANRIRKIIVTLLVTLAVVILVMVGYNILLAGLNRTELVLIRFLPFRPTLAYYYSAFLAGSVMMLVFQAEKVIKVFKKDDKGSE